jgi:hypothetical protein
MKKVFWGLVVASLAWVVLFSSHNDVSSLAIESAPDPSGYQMYIG